MSKSFIIDLPGFGRIAFVGDRGGSALQFPGGMQFHTNLKGTHYRNGKILYTRDLGSGLVTTAGVHALADAFANTATHSGFDPQQFNLHDTSTGTTGAAVGDTGLATAPASTVGARVAGAQSTASVSTNFNYITTATQAYTGSLAITEWGLFKQARAAGAAPPTAGSASGQDQMWDRKTFAAYNVVTGDGIAWTYTLTITAGG